MMDTTGHTHGPIWILLCVQFALLVLVAVFCSYWWEARTMDKVNGALSEHYQDVNTLLENQNTMVNEELKSATESAAEPTPTPKRFFVVTPVVTITP